MVITTWEAIQESFGQLLLLFLGTFVGSIPIFWNMRQQDSSIKSPLTIAGKIIAAVFIVLLIISGLMIVSDKKESLEKERLSSIQRQKDEEQKSLDSKRIVDIQATVNRLEAKDKRKDEAIHKSGFNYDSIRVVLRPLWNLSSNDKKRLLKELHGIKDVAVVVTSAAQSQASFRFAKQVKEFLQFKGFTLFDVGNTVIYDMQRHSGFDVVTGNPLAHLNNPDPNVKLGEIYVWDMPEN